jgi:hypothetical protein
MGRLRVDGVDLVVVVLSGEAWRCRLGSALGSADGVESPSNSSRSRAVCKPSRKLRRFESSTRHTLLIRPLTCGDWVRGRSCRSGRVRWSPAVYERSQEHAVAGTADHVVVLVPVRDPVAVDPSIGERARPQRRHRETGVRHGNHAGGAGGESARLARVDGGRASRSPRAPAGASLVGTWRWQRAERAVRREQRRMTTACVRHRTQLILEAGRKTI